MRKSQVLKRIEELQEEIQSRFDERADKQRQIDDLTQENEELSRRYSQSWSKQESNLEKIRDLERIIKQLEEIKNQHQGVIQGAVRALRERPVGLFPMETAAKALIRQLEAKFSSNQAEINSKRALLSQNKTKLVSFRQRFERACQEVQNEASKLRDKDQNLEDLDLLIHNHNQEIEELTQNQERKRRENQELIERLKFLVMHTLKLEKDVKSQSAEIERLKKEFERRVNGHDRIIKKLENDPDFNINQNHPQIQNLKEEIHSLELEISQRVNRLRFSEQNKEILTQERDELLRKLREKSQRCLKLKRENRDRRSLDLIFLN